MILEFIISKPGIPEFLIEASLTNIDDKQFIWRSVKAINRVSGIEDDDSHMDMLLISGFMSLADQIMVSH